MKTRIKAFAVVLLLVPLALYAALNGRDSGNSDESTQRIVPAAPATLTTGQVALNSSTATQIVAASTTRKSVVIENHDASIVIYVGISSVTAGTGIKLAAGLAISFDGSEAIYAISASGTPTAGYAAESY